jgi:hypothetical protein
LAFLELLHIHWAIFGGEKAKFWPVKVGGAAWARNAGLVEVIVG